jgi:hypothetical protein
MAALPVLMRLLIGAQYQSKDILREQRACVGVNQRPIGKAVHRIEKRMKWNDNLRSEPGIGLDGISNVSSTFETRIGY